MGIRKKHRGVTIRKSKNRNTIYISFMYRNIQCREPLPSLDSELQGDMDYAYGIKLEIERKIMLGQFQYNDYFPNSAKLKLFGLTNSKKNVLDYLNEYVKDAEKRGLSPSTLQGYEKAIKALQPFHDVLVTDLKPADIKQYVKSADVKIKTMKNRLSVLKTALREAIIEGVIQLNPCDSVRPSQYMNIDQKIDINDEHDDVDPFSPAEIKHVLNSCRNQQEKNLLQFAFYSGLRSSELAALRWKHVDIQSGEVHVREAVLWLSRDQKRITKKPKTSSSRRVITLLPEALAALRAQAEFTLNKSEFVFVEPKQGTPLNGDSQIRKNIWVPVLRISNLKYRNPYQTRHTFATMLISRNENLWWIAKQMGHNSPEMLYRHYGNYIEEHAKKH